MDFFKVWGISRCEMFGECARVKSQALDVSLIVLAICQLIVDGSKISIEPEPEASKMFALTRMRGHYPSIKT